MPPQSRPSLTGQLDQEVYQVVLKFLAAEDGDVRVPRVSEVYNYIKNSNSSLARRPKKLLENSIERAIHVMEMDMQSDSVAANEETIPKEKVDSNIMNRHITAQWSKKIKPILDTSKDQPMIDATQESAEPPKSKKRLRNGEPPRNNPRTISHMPTSGANLSDLGGVGPVILQLAEITLPLVRPRRKRIERGILLHGPSGCGKTTIVNAFAAQLGVPFITIEAPSIISGVIGDTERALREHFEEAKRVAPSLIFIDDIDAIAMKREQTTRDTGRLVSQLRICMNGLVSGGAERKPVIVIATTTNPDSLDPDLRGTRFGTEISIGIPKEPARKKILRVLTKDLNCADDVDFGQLARQTPGFVGADLKNLVAAAESVSEKAEWDFLVEKGKELFMDLDIDDEEPDILRAIRLIKAARLSNDEDPVPQITNANFFQALPKIQPAIKREGFATVPDTTWEDIGALDQIRKVLSTAITEPILNPAKYAKVGITAPSGVLLWGPPGCGKTLLAKAVANEGRANFISVKGPDLLNKYVGESERAVRQVFNRARASAPCIIFFDEIDALAGVRDDGAGASGVRIVNTLLTELDGLDDRKGIYVIAATNRPDMIDSALLRPGRLEKLLFVGLPEKSERGAILRTILRGYNTDESSEEIRKVAEACEGFSGADLANLARRAGEITIEHDEEYIKPEFFALARKDVEPSVTDVKKYRLKKAL